jgi:hypothetical protein
MSGVGGCSLAAQKGPLCIPLLSHPVVVLTTPQHICTYAVTAATAGKPPTQLQQPQQPALPATPTAGGSACSSSTALTPPSLRTGQVLTALLV